jgi:hypothetical protein
MIRLANVLIASLVLCLSLSSVLAQSDSKSSPSGGGGTISGRVTVQGNGLGRATVTLWRQPLGEPTGSNLATNVRTDPEGNYLIAKVPPGSYFIAASAPGFVTTKENLFPPNLRALAMPDSQTVKGIDFELVRGGVITGRVCNADGKPLIEQPITLIPQEATPDFMMPAYGRDIRTDDRGVYRVYGVPPGHYRIAVGQPTAAAASFMGRPAYRRTFYADATDELKAAVIDVTSGGEVSNVDINVAMPAPVFSVRGLIVDGETAQPMPNMSYGMEVYSGQKRVGGIVPPGVSNDKGEFRIDNLPAGTYLISTPSRGSTFQSVSAMQTAPNVYGDSARFDITDQDVSGIVIRTTKGASVSGVIVVEGTTDRAILAKVPEMRVMVFGNPKPGGLGSTRTATIDEDGTFSVSGLRPGTLRFSFFPPPDGKPLPIRFSRTERNGASLSQDVEVKAGEEIDGVRLVFTYATGSVGGVVKFENGPMPSNTSVRATLIQNGHPIEGTMADAGGRFLMQNLPAGEYKLIVSAYTSGAKTRAPIVEQQITVSDNQVTRAAVTLDLTPNPR